MFIRALLASALALTAAAAVAQTSAAGPYYATPSWDQTMPIATRFVTLTNFNGAALLDRETGLVWSKNDSRQLSTGPTDFQHAQSFCSIGAIGGRSGWRLPTLAELSSLTEAIKDPGSPFNYAYSPSNNPLSDFYWVATPVALSSDEAYVFAFTSFYSFGLVRGSSGEAAGQFLFTCVRGGSNAAG